MIDKIKAALWKNGSFLSQIIMYMIDSQTRERVDVSKFLNNQITDKESLEILIRIRDNNNLMRYTKDIRAMKIRDFVQNFLTYQDDMSRYNSVEHWASIKEILEKLVGDCEDGAILIYCLMRISGFNENEVQLITGYVINPFDNKKVGHCWINYISDKYPYVNYFLDWCYYPDKTRIHNKRECFSLRKGLIYSGTKQDDRYLSYWFLATDKQGWK